MKIYFPILFLLWFGTGYGQTTSEGQKGYDLYIYYEETGAIFTKPVAVESDSLQISVYTLDIPNQKHPMVLFSFDPENKLNIFIKGANGDFQGYSFSFSYNSQQNEQFLIEEGKYVKDKINLGWIMSSNLEVFDEVLEKANHIYILENTEKEGYKYVAREVSFSEYAGL